MRMLHTRKGGFTLIELMIVVAIIGILAAIAIPNFLQFQLRSKTGEAKTNLAAIRTAEEGYFAEFNNYVAAPSTPGTTATANKRAEMWAAMRAWLRHGAIPDDPDLKADLTAVQYGFNVKGEILLEAKDTMKKRGLASPDDGDGLALTFAFPVARRPARPVGMPEHLDGDTAVMGDDWAPYE